MMMEATFGEQKSLSVVLESSGQEMILQLLKNYSLLLTL